MKEEGEFLLSMASTASAKSQSLHNFTLPFDLKWSTSNNNNNNNGDNSNDSCDTTSKNNGGGGSNGGGGGGGNSNNGGTGRSSKQRTRKFGDSSLIRRPPPPQLDSAVSKEGLESERRSRIQVFERVGNYPNVSSSSSDRWIEKSEKKMVLDRLIEKSDKKATTTVFSNPSLQKPEKKVAVLDRLVEKPEKKGAVFDRLVEKPEKKVAGFDRMVEKPEKKVVVSERLIEKPEKKAIGPDRLNEKSEKKASGSDRLIEKLEKKASGSDRLIEKSEKKVTVTDRAVEKSEKKAKVPDRLVEKSEKKVTATATATASDRLVEKSEKKVVLSDPLTEKSEEKLEGSDVKSKLLIRIKAKNKLEDGVAEEGTESGGGGGGGVEGEDLEVKTWNLRPRRPVSKKPNANGGTSSYTGGGALLQETNKSQTSQLVAGGSSKTKNETTRVRTHADAKIAQSKAKKKRFSIPLSKEEIEDDFFVMTGSKPARRPKKRAKNVQKQLDCVFPGLWLSSITPDSYKVTENLPKG